VVNTDVVQFFLAIVGTGIFAWVAVQAAGGFGGLSDRVVELYGAEEASRMLSFGPETAPDLLLPFLTIIGLQWFFQMNSDGTGYLAQRSMACRSDKDARVAGVIFTWAQIFFRSLFWLAIAVALLVVYPFTPEQPNEMGGEAFAASREILFVTGIDDLLPPGLRGLMLVGLLAALASTVDTHLNWGAGYWSNDIYDRLWCQHIRRREPKGNELVIVARLSNVLILGIALVVMANLGAIQTAWFISLLFGAGMGAVLVLRWLWERINLYSEFAAMAVSLVTAPILLVTFGVDPGDGVAPPRHHGPRDDGGGGRHHLRDAADQSRGPARLLRARAALRLVARDRTHGRRPAGGAAARTRAPGRCDRRDGRLALPSPDRLWATDGIAARHEPAVDMGGDPRGLALIPVWIRYLLADDLGLDRAQKATSRARSAR
jgi:hypothetical protein